MIRLPDLPASNPQQAAPSAASVAAPARALQDISQGLATTGQALQSEARQQWNQQYAQLNQELATETDPAQIPLRTQELLTNLQGTLEDDRLPPAVRERLSQQYADFSSRATISAGERASSLAITRAKKSFQNEIDAAIRNHDMDALHAALDTAGPAFGLLPEDRERILTDAERTTMLDLLDIDISADPVGFAELTIDEIRESYPMLERSQIRSAQGRARQLVQKIRSEEIDLLTDALDQGQLTEQQIEESPNLTARDRVQLKRALNRNTEEPVDLTQHAAAWDILLNLRNTYKDPETTDAQYAAAWNEARLETMAMLPPNYQGDIRQELSYRSPANRRGGAGSPAENLPRNSQNRSEARAFITQAFNTGLFGDKDSWEAFNARQDLHVALDAYIQQNPGKSWQETREWLQKTIGIEVTGHTPLIQVPGLTPAPAPITREDIENVMLLPEFGTLPDPTR